mmetsp:Transcript_24247/g.58005  ORF Transcript_24247/g.58005 Transcript_24247/m.58005 type:complete len:270 (-) Transcript_24247:436-1245(-)
MYVLCPQAGPHREHGACVLCVGHAHVAVQPAEALQPQPRVVPRDDGRGLDGRHDNGHLVTPPPRQRVGCVVLQHRGRDRAALLSSERRGGTVGRDGLEERRALASDLLVRNDPTEGAHRDQPRAHLLDAHVVRVGRGRRVGVGARQHEGHGAALALGARGDLDRHRHRHRLALHVAAEEVARERLEARAAALDTAHVSSRHRVSVVLAQLHALPRAHYAVARRLQPCGRGAQSVLRLVENGLPLGLVGRQSRQPARDLKADERVGRRRG